jgi:hypothetical protein
VAFRARAQGKALVTFSHYPMVEFYRGEGETIAGIFGPRGLDLPRSPRPETTRALAGLGLGVHFGGHLHINDTGVYRGDGGFLVNVQIPSLAAYVPGYKIATVGTDRVEVDTVVVQDVQGFNALFEHYEDEHRALEASGAPVWDRVILSAGDYRQFARIHLRELVRLRFLPRNWPPEVRGLLGLSLADLVQLAFLETGLTCAAVQGFSDLPRALGVAASCTAPTPAPGRGSSEPETPGNRAGLLGAWELARIRATQALGVAVWDALGDHPAWELAVDFHRVVSAGELARDDVAPRWSVYRVIGKVLGQGPVPVLRDDGLSADSPLTSVLHHRLGPVVRLINAVDQASPSRSFTVDLEGQTVTARTPSTP